MTHIKRLIFVLAMTMVLAPMLGLANDPFPDCYPCDTTFQAQ